MVSQVTIKDKVQLYKGEEPANSIELLQFKIILIMKYLFHPCTIVLYILIILWIFFPATLNILVVQIQFFLLYALYEYYMKNHSPWWNDKFK